MGVTDVRSITVDGVKDFKARIASEDRARQSWAEKYGWMLEEYKRTGDELRSLKTRRTLEKEEPGPIDPRTTLPIPDTVNHEIQLSTTKTSVVLIMNRHHAYYLQVEGELAIRESLIVEERSRRLWHETWGWMLDEYRILGEELRKLKKERHTSIMTIKDDPRSSLPRPLTGNHEYGWLVSKPGWQLETYATPSLTRIPKEMPYALEEAILVDHLNRGRRFKSILITRV